MTSGDMRILRSVLATAHTRENLRVKVVKDLLGVVRDGLMVLRTRDGVPLTDDQIEERARNVVGAIVGNYNVTSLD